MKATVRRVGSVVDAIDVFAGAGGASSGLEAAGVHVKAACNHSEYALAVHAANHTATAHLQYDLVSETDPQIINGKGKKVAGKYMNPRDLPAARLAWFSPSCTHHSQANSKKIYAKGLQVAIDEDPDWDEQAFVNSERSRVTMSCVLAYAEAHQPEIIIVENVVEVVSWGPNRDGSTFKWWMKELRTKLGYEVEPLFLNSRFFPPCPQSRDRIYIVCWRKGNKRPDLDYRPRAYCTSDRCGGRHVDAVQTFKRPTKAWMGLPRYGKFQSQYTYNCPDCGREVHPATWTAASAIDFSNPGEPLGARAKPLASNTMERIRKALRKYWYAPPLLMPAPTLPLFVKNNGKADEAHYRGHHGGMPIGAVTAGCAQSIATLNMTAHQPLITTVAGNTFERAGSTCRTRHALDTLFTQSTTLEHGLAMVPVVRGDHAQHRHAGGDPITTVSAGGNHIGLATLFTKLNGGPDDTIWHEVGDPFNTVTGRDTHGLVMLPWLDQWRANPLAFTDDIAINTALMHDVLRDLPEFDGEISDDVLMQVCFRMFDPDPELRRGMAFADDFILFGTKAQMTSALGNAVTPPVATWITERCLDTLRDLSDSDRNAA